MLPRKVETPFKSIESTPCPFLDEDNVSRFSSFSVESSKRSRSVRTEKGAGKPQFTGIKDGTNIVNLNFIKSTLSYFQELQLSVKHLIKPLLNFNYLVDLFLEVDEESWEGVEHRSVNVIRFYILGRIIISIKVLDGSLLDLSVKPNASINSVKELIEKQEGILLSRQRLLFEGKVLSSDQNLLESGVRKGSLINLCLAQTGGKPVIYLFPPKSISSIDVSLALCPQWNFSAIYPLTRITTGSQRSQRVKWNVAASSNGDLVDLSSGRELSYLLWEAVSHYSLPSPTLSAIDGITNQAIAAFDPSRPILNSNNSILLPFTEFIAYLDDTLKLLTLHVSARNDFITYWLPHFVAIHEKGQFISMRFLEQVDYEKAAILDIKPVPEVVTRVFMLFKGVDSDENGWAAARERVGTVDWRTVVGIKEDALNLENFRVLEWGGMEVA